MKLHFDNKQMAWWKNGLLTGQQNVSQTWKCLGISEEEQKIESVQSCLCYNASVLHTMLDFSNRF